MRRLMKLVCRAFLNPCELYEKNILPIFH
jgi:hypothetical protein